MLKTLTFSSILGKFPSLSQSKLHVQNLLDFSLTGKKVLPFFQFSSFFQSMWGPCTIVVLKKVADQLYLPTLSAHMYLPIP